MLLSPIHYSCDLQIPQDVINNDPESLLANQPNQYVYVQTGQLDENNSAILTIPIYMESDRFWGSKEFSNLQNNLNAFLINYTANSTSPLNSPTDELRNLTETVKDIRQVAFDYWCLNFRYYFFRLAD